MWLIREGLLREDVTALLFLHTSTVSINFLVSIQAGAEGGPDCIGAI